MELSDQEPQSHDTEPTKPVFALVGANAEFKDKLHAVLVSQLMKVQGMTFAEAVDYSELRRGYPWDFA